MADSVDELIRQLRDLEIQQATIVHRLAAVQTREREAHQAEAARVPRANFCIGNRVEITNEVKSFFKACDYKGPAWYSDETHQTAHHDANVQWGDSLLGPYQRSADKHDVSGRCHHPRWQQRIRWWAAEVTLEEVP